jgi:curli biogenesis system outer membrane secretion channel CsgG
MLEMQIQKNKKFSSQFSKVAITALCSLILSACMSTDPTMGSASGHTITGAAGGANADGQNSALETCDETLGTLSVFEDQNQTWWHDYRGRYPELGSTVPVLRTMIQQSNCFVVVERGRSMAAMTAERELMQSGQLRDGSNLGAGQMVAADYTMSPEIQFSAKGTSGMKAIGGALFGSIGAIVGGGLSSNEAATTLLLIDNRSGVQISAAVGNAENTDYNFLGGMFAGFMGGGASGFADTPEGKVISASFADSFNKMVKALKSYKAQEVEGGLGKGGKLNVGN